MSEEKLIKSIVQIGLKKLSENAEAIGADMDEKGPENTIPAFIANTISSIVNSIESEDISIEVIGAAAVALFAQIDKMFTEADKQLTKEQKIHIISSSIEITLQMLPDYYDAFIEQAGGMQELERVGNMTDDDPEFEKPTREGTAGTMEQGVL